MATINIRNVSDETYRAVKVAAASSGLTLRDYVLKAIMPVSGTPENIKENHEKEKSFEVETGSEVSQMSQSLPQEAVARSVRFVSRESASTSGVDQRRSKASVTIKEVPKKGHSLGQRRSEGKARRRDQGKVGVEQGGTFKYAVVPDPAVKPPEGAPVVIVEEARPADLKAKPWLAKDSDTRRYLHQFGMAKGHEPSTVAEWEGFLKRGW